MSCHWATQSDDSPRLPSAAESPLSISWDGQA